MDNFPAKYRNGKKIEYKIFKDLEKKVCLMRWNGKA